MSALYNELLEKGFSPVLNFKNDGYTKVLHIENFGEDVRLSELGQVIVPVLTLTNQNKTLKGIPGGVRVHLAVSVSDEPTPSLITCAGATSTAIISGVWNTSDIIRIVGNALDSVKVEVNGVVFQHTVNEPDGINFGALYHLFESTEFRSLIDELGITIGVDSTPSYHFYNGTSENVRVRITPLSEVAKLAMTAQNINPETWDYNPTLHQDETTGVITFCIVRNPQ